METVTISSAEYKMLIRAAEDLALIQAVWNDNHLYVTDVLRLVFKAIEDRG